MFLDRLREYGRLCAHGDRPSSFYLTSDGTDEWVRCRECPHAASVSRFLCEEVSPLVSPTFAREYAEWTGHVDVPCTFRYAALESRVVPAGPIRTRFSTLHRGRDLLKAVHSPFVRGAAGDRRTIDPNIFKHLLKEYVSLIDRVSSSVCEGERQSESSAGTSGGEEGDAATERGRREGALTVSTVLSNMKKAFEEVDMYDQYFNVLAPYVKYARFLVDEGGNEEENKKTYLPDEYGRVFDEDEPELPFSAVLERELNRSTFLHRHFSPYCIPFEVIHVMVLCYLCGDDTEVVYNLVLDMVAKLCCGFYSFPPSRTFDVGLEIRMFLEQNVTPTKNLKFYYLVRQFRKGGNELGECFSEEFLRRYGQLESEIRKRVPSTQAEGKMEKFVYQQTYPYVLFEDCEDGDDSGYYAFVLALAHYVSKSNPNAANGGCAQGGGRVVAAGGGGPFVQKGVLSECKRLFKFVRECMAVVRELDGGETQNVKMGIERRHFWTRDTFNLLLSTNDGNLGRQLFEVIGTMMYNPPPPTQKT